MPDGPLISCWLVCDALPELQLVPMRVVAGCTIAQLLQQARQPLSDLGIDWQRVRVGVWGQECGRERRLQAGDRVEIYRALPNDPKTARRRRAREALRQQRSVRRPAR
jgi:putative ubiquitin-RnfH superfamily antitoxin RatB of RatAB toxin-antitoxin module